MLKMHSDYSTNTLACVWAARGHDEIFVELYAIDETMHTQDTKQPREVVVQNRLNEMFVPERGSTESN